MTSERLIDYSGGLGPARGREAPCAPSLKVRASRYDDKRGLCRRARVLGKALRWTVTCPSTVTRRSGSL